jgi:hypothetical protein
VFYGTQVDAETLNTNIDFCPHCSYIIHHASVTVECELLASSLNGPLNINNVNGIYSVVVVDYSHISVVVEFLN